MYFVYYYWALNERRSRLKCQFIIQYSMGSQAFCLRRILFSPISIHVRSHIQRHRRCSTLCTQKAYTFRMTALGKSLRKGVSGHAARTHRTNEIVTKHCWWCWKSICAFVQFMDRKWLNRIDVKMFYVRRENSSSTFNPLSAILAPSSCEKMNQWFGVVL